MNPREIERRIGHDIVRTETQRLQIFIALFSFGLVLLWINQYLAPEGVEEVFRDERSLTMGTYVSLLLIGVLSISRIFVGRIHRKGKFLPRSYQFFSVAFESLAPFVWLFIILNWERNPVFLDSPLIYAFIPIIVVSALHLNFWVSVVNGSIIGIVYIAISFWAIGNFEIAPVFPNIVYTTKGIFLIISGLCAGFVARELRQRLTQSIQENLERNELETLFNQQVSKEVVTAIRADELIRGEATVLFLDVRNFTQRVQKMDPQEVNKFQNDFLSPIIEIINRNEGIINQIMGDGIMATFGSQDESHSGNALNSAKEILKEIELREIKARNEIGIGIHTGEIMAGNIGTEERKQFSISGMPVITAARLEQLTKEYRCSLIVSGYFFEKVKTDVNEFENLGMVQLKGIDEPVELIKLA